MLDKRMNCEILIEEEKGDKKKGWLDRKTERQQTNPFIHLGV